MGCGCGGSSRRSAAGTNPATPIVYGDDDESLPVRRVIVVRGSGGVPSGAPRWVRGSGVDTEIVNGNLRLLGG